MTASLSRKINYYRIISHEIFDTNKLYKLFIDLYNNFLFNDKFKWYFDHETCCYLRYCLKPVKNLFLCSNVLMHFFNCPRSNYAVNNCKQCSRLFVRSDSTDFLASLELRYNLIFVNCAFFDSVQPFFKESFITRFNLNIAYKSHKHYKAIMSDQKRCLELSVFNSPCDIIVKCCEVLVRIYANYFYFVFHDFKYDYSMDIFTKKLSQKKEFFLSLFSFYASVFQWYDTTYTVSSV